MAGQVQERAASQEPFRPDEDVEGGREAVADQIGISRPQLANALQGRFGLSRSAATNLLEWLAA
ncbi:hypothetical protein [Methylobacterium sp. OT2]|uniref:hypothetical protein n=1 Tax=Methylobacterium sp. OT2 TaxID=2813779 RepID=UPI001FEFEC3D|nr:hypothetical protein [Methylobacterium sp. OT2]